MKPRDHKTSDQYAVFYAQFSRAVYANRVLGGFFGMSVLICVLFGILVWVLAFGLFLGFWILALTFDPLYRILRSMLPVEGLPPHLIKISLWRIAWSSVSLVFPAFFVYVGVKGLQHIGFCSQNLICIFGRLLFY